MDIFPWTYSSEHFPRAMVVTRYNCEIVATYLAGNCMASTYGKISGGIFRVQQWENVLDCDLATV
jgi:hypothetical protein